MDNKQTAVEWLVRKINQELNYISITQWDRIRDIVQQAKVMEKEQLWRIYLYGWTTKESLDDFSPDIIYPEGLDYEEKQEYAFEQYYNEHYES